MRFTRLAVSCLSLGILLASPALASGAQSLSVTSPTGFPAGGDPSYTTNAKLDTSAGTPSTVTVKLAPGVLASAAANPSCLKGAPQHTAACQIGTGSVLTALPVGIPFKVYLVPPPAKADVVGIAVVTAATTTTGGAQLVQTPAGGVQTVLSLSLSGLGPLANLVSGMSLTVNGTLNGKPFNRMPTNCSPGHSQLTVVYSKKTETVSASPDFAPSGCKALPFAPHITGSVRADRNGDSHGTVVTTITQSAKEASTAQETLVMPSPTLTPNFNALALLNKNVPVGTVVGSSPLLPSSLAGHIYLTGSTFKPTVTFRFPPPVSLTLTGKVDVAHNSVSIPIVPDVPLTRLHVVFPGGPKALLAVECHDPTGTLKGIFTGQNHKTFTSTDRITIQGCVAPK